MPRLFNIPIIHGATEMDSAAAAYRAAYIAKFGEGKWLERSAEFDAIWRALGEAIAALDLDYKHVKLFQDSLPVCGRELTLTRDLAAKGSRNHQLIMSLIERGAMLVGTESAPLLLEEYHLLRAGKNDGALAAKLLEERDRFVAARIEQTLGDDDCGLLFMGALHRVPDYLAPRIRVETLAPRNL